MEELGDNRFRVSARLPIEDLGELCEIEFGDDLDFDTVGAWWRWNWAVFRCQVPRWSRTGCDCLPRAAPISVAGSVSARCS